ncbi:MAG: DNA mismatch repair protein MutS, partial [Wenzhouxiangella sp.]|nr:DNA mismatch repair protein MutS [Wenzhouxiangella sp.]
EGPASQSYGIQVARLAGVPRPVIAQARQHLRRLEDDAARAHSPQLGLSSTSPGGEASAPEPDPVRELVDQLDPDQLSPREALDWLYQLKASSQEDDH